jgi:hypothetical protein
LQIRPFALAVPAPEKNGLGPVGFRRRQMAEALIAGRHRIRQRQCTGAIEQVLDLLAFDDEARSDITRQ